MQSCVGWVPLGLHAALMSDEEKQQAEEAVEQEKVKMRKLVKVLATREKQEIAQSSPSSSIVPITQTVGSSSMKSRKVTNTGRGLMPK